jgi:hypothetical protein
LLLHKKKIRKEKKSHKKEDEKGIRNGERSSYLTDNERNDKSIENLNKEYVKDCFIYSAVVHCAKIRQYHQHHHQHQSRRCRENEKSLFFLILFVSLLLFLSFLFNN